MSDEKVNQNESGQGYQIYDFERPNKFSVENLKSLETISRTFCKALSQSLSARLRTSEIEVEYEGIEQIPFTSEYTEKLPKDEFAFVVSDFGSEFLHEFVIELDLAFCVNVHRRYLGREFPKELEKREPLTAIEQFSVKKFLSNTLYPDFAAAFQNITNIEPKFERVESDPDLIGGVTIPTDMVALVSFDITTPYWSTTLRLVIPYKSIEDLIHNFKTEHVREFRQDNKGKDYKKEIQEGIGKVEEQVQILVGKSRMALKDLEACEVGSVLTFNQKMTEPSKGFAAGVHKFDCEVGRVHKRKAFHFLNFVNEDGEKELEEEVRDEQ